MGVVGGIVLFLVGGLACYAYYRASVEVKPEPKRPVRKRRNPKKYNG